MPKKLKILILEDDPYDAELTIASLQDSGYTCEWTRVETQAEFMARLDEVDYDIILADYALPTFDGLTALKHVIDSDIDLPFILVSGTVGEEIAIDSLKAGAADYVLKDRLARLGPVVKRALHEKELEQQSKEADNETRYQAQLLQSVSNAIIGTDMNFNIQSWNDAAVRMYGWETREVMGKAMGDVLPTSYPFDQQEDALVHFLNEGDWQGEVIQPRKDGTTINVLASVSLIRDKAGVSTGMVAVNQDITERRQTEEALRESGERYARAVTAGKVGIWEWSPDSNEIHIDPRLKAMLGYENHEIQNRRDDWGKYMHPDDVERVMTAAKAHFDGLTPDFEIEHRMLRKDGSIRWFLARGTASRDATGKAFRMIGTDLDITELKLAEEALRRSEAKNQALLVAIPDIMFRISRDGVYLDYMPASGVEPFAPLEQLLGKSQADVLPAELAEQAEYYLERALQTNEMQIFEYELDLTDEERVYESRLVVSGEDEVLAIVRDITERKQAEAALQRYAQRMEILHKIDLDILAVRSSEEIAYAALRRLKQLIRYERASVVLYDFAAAEAHFLAVDDEQTSGFDTSLRIPLDPMIREQIEELKQGKTVINDLNDSLNALLEGTLQETDQTPELLRQNIGRAAQKGLAGEAHRSQQAKVLTAPLVVQGELIGALNLIATHPASVASDNLDIASEVAGQLSVALHNASLYEAEQRALKMAKTLQAANLALTQTLELSLVLDTILHYLKQLVPYDSANVMLTETGTTLRIWAVSGYELWTDPNNAQGITFDAKSVASFQPMFASGQTVLISDTEHYPGWELTGASQHVRNWLGVPLIAGGETIGLYSLDKAVPGFFTAEHIQVAEALAPQATVAIQNARLFEAEQRRRQEAETLGMVTEALVSTLDLDQILQLILDKLAEVVAYDSAALLLIEEDYLRVVASQGFSQLTPVIGQVFPANNELSRQLREGGHSIWLTDAQTNPHFEGWGRTADVRGWMGVPLFAHGTFIGFMTLDSREPNVYGAAHATLVEPLANQAAQAIENARLLAEVQQYAAQLEQRVDERTAELEQQYRQQAVLEERQRLARDLHDAVSQTLFSASVIAETLPRLWDRNPQLVQQSLGDLHRLTRGALAEMRTLLVELRPTSLADADLEDLLHQLTDMVSGRIRIETSLNVETQRVLPPEVKTVFFRIAQEAMNNIIKHAKASHLAVTFRGHQGQVILQINDDGRGFDRNLMRSGHLGLKIMEERAETIDAVITINSQVGHGTEVRVAWSGN